MGKSYNSYNKRNYEYEYEDENKKIGPKPRQDENNTRRQLKNRDLLKKWQNYNINDEDYY